MHDSRAVFLLPKSPRYIKASYHPVDENGNVIASPNSQYTNKIGEFKTFDETIKVGDHVVVETGSRLGMTAAVVTSVDEEIDIESTRKVLWILDTIDTQAHKAMVKKENELLGAVRKAQRIKKRKELQEAYFDGVNEEDLLQLTASNTEPVIEDASVSQAEEVSPVTE